MPPHDTNSPTSTQPQNKAVRRNTIIAVGSGKAGVKIYTLRRKDGYPSFQCVWYELRQRKTKTFSKLEAAKLFAQQIHSMCRQEAPDLNPVTYRDFEMMRECEARARRFGLSLVSAFEEWSLMSCPHLSELPALRWKLQNLAKLKKMNPRKFQQQAEALSERLEG